MLGIKPGPHGNVRSKRTTPGLPARDIYPGRARVSQGATRPGRESLGRAADVNSRAFCCCLTSNPLSSAQGGEERIRHKVGTRGGPHGVGAALRPGWADASGSLDRGSGVTVPPPLECKNQTHAGLMPGQTHGADLEGWDGKTRSPHEQPCHMSEASWPRPACLFCIFGGLTSGRE